VSRVESRALFSDSRENAVIDMAFPRCALLSDTPRRGVALRAPRVRVPSTPPDCPRIPCRVLGIRSLANTEILASTRILSRGDRRFHPTYDRLSRGILGISLPARNACDFALRTEEPAPHFVRSSRKLVGCPHRVFSNCGGDVAGSGGVGRSRGDPRSPIRH